MEAEKLLEELEVKKLGEVCSKPQYGYTTKAKTEEIGPIYLRITDIDNFGAVNFNNIKYAKIEDGELKKFVLEEDDILIARSGSIGKVYLHKDIGKKVIFASYLIRFKPNKEIIQPKFLFYYLHSPIFYRFVEKEKIGVAQFNLNARKMSMFKLKIPPIPIQQKIVQKLDAFFGYYNNLKKEKQRAKEKYEQILQSAIASLIPPEELPDGWELKKLSNRKVTKKITSGGTPRRGEKKYWKNGTIPWLKSGELEDSYIYEIEEKITEEGLKNSSAKYFESNTVLIALYGATVGKTGLLKIKSTTNQAVCGIIPNENKLFYKYLFYFLQSRRAYFVSKSFGGAQPNISQGVIKNLDIPLPDINKQKKIVKIIEDVVKKRDFILYEQKSIDHQLEQLPKSVLSKAFRGELV